MTSTPLAKRTWRKVLAVRSVGVRDSQGHPRVVSKEKNGSEWEKREELIAVRDARPTEIHVLSSRRKARASRRARSMHSHNSPDQSFIAFTKCQAIELSGIRFLKRD